MNARVQTIVKSSSFPAKRSPRHNYKSILTKCSNSTFVTRFNFNNRDFDDIETSEDKQIRINALNQELERIKNPSSLFFKEHKTLMSSFNTNNNSMQDRNDEERLFQ
ncbi:Hypothetical_protein [Hexamita inflata]|uniref:Hypothetical_protein n=1 Tax=Hexamita inflata TaxID=28002 RepID=A0AA86U1P5_9EUKA|nr:Hypothetical protein HINF_LOCUS26265 [Hexamita inflata]